MPTLIYQRKNVVLNSSSFIFEIC